MLTKNNNVDVCFPANSNLIYNWWFGPISWTLFPISSFVTYCLCRLVIYLKSTAGGPGGIMYGNLATNPNVAEEEEELIEMHVV
jgi:hypothetical protein